MKVTGNLSSRGPGDAARRPLPAPPVPPRPSKALVAEALARTRSLTHEAAAATRPTPSVVPTPSRRAPPPPASPSTTTATVTTTTSNVVFGEVVRRRHVVRNDDAPCDARQLTTRNVDGYHVNGSETLLSVGGTSDIAPEDALQPGKTNGRFEWNELSDHGDHPRTVYSKSPHVLSTGQHKHDNSHYSSITPTTILMIDNSPSKPVSPVLAHHEIPLVEDLVAELRERSLIRTHSDHSDKQDTNYSVLTSSKKGIVKTCIQHSDWFQVEDDGHPIRYSSCQITLEDPPGAYGSEQQLNVGLPFRNYHSQQPPTLVGYGGSAKSPFYFNKRRERMASLQGLPPLPKSLSGMNLLEGAAMTGVVETEAPTRSSSRQVAVAAAAVAPVLGVRPGTSRSSQSASSHPRGLPPPHSPSAGDAPRPRQSTGLDAQLAVLRTEMFGLRQLDLSLLAQLWSLNESIQEFRQLLQDQDTLSPPSPSSADDGDDYYHYLTSVPEQYCLSTSSSQSSIEFGNV